MLCCLKFSIRAPVRRLDGTVIRADANRCVLFDKPGQNFLGTRIFGSVPREIRGGAKEVKYKSVIEFASSTI